MKKLLNILYYVFMVSYFIYYNSNYQSFSVVEMWFFTATSILFGGIMALDIIDFIVKRSKENSGE